MADWLADERMVLLTAENHAMRVELAKLRKANHYLALDLTQAHHDLNRFVNGKVRRWRWPR